MPYTATIPQPGDLISASQPLILNNFAEISNTVGIDHVAFNNADQGKHAQTTFTNVAAPAFAATEIGIYNNNASGVQELYVKKAAGVGYPFTAANAAANGWTRLPSGILLKWGSLGGTGDFTMTNNTAPYFATIFNVQITGRTDNIASNGKTMVLRTWTIAPGVSFTLNLTSVERLSNLVATGTCHWLVIGI